MSQTTTTDAPSSSNVLPLTTSGGISMQVANLQPSTSSFLTQSMTSNRSLTSQQRRHCPDPAPLRGGSILSSGPYLANVTYATFSCFTGFTLQGTGQLFCRIDGTWSNVSPSCVPVTNNPEVDTRIAFGDYGNVPLWLAIVMGATLGAIFLLLLTCLCMYCMKICGCWRGSVHCNDGMAGWDRTRYRGGCCCIPTRQTVPSSRDNRITVENMDTANQMYNYTDQPGRTRYQHGRPSQTSSYTLNPESSLQMWKADRQKQAKIPENGTWMPHSNQIRNINTSTH